MIEARLEIRMLSTRWCQAQDRSQVQVNQETRAPTEVVVDTAATTGVIMEVVATTSEEATTTDIIRKVIPAVAAEIPPVGKERQVILNPLLSRRMLRPSSKRLRILQHSIQTPTRGVRNHPIQVATILVDLRPLPCRQPIPHPIHLGEIETLVAIHLADPEPRGLARPEMKLGELLLSQLRHHNQEAAWSLLVVEVSGVAKSQNKILNNLASIFASVYCSPLSYFLSKEGLFAVM
jgi:hypothetical protein